MPKLAKAPTSKVKRANKMRSKGMPVGAIARRLHVGIEEANRLVWGENYREKLRVFPSGKRSPFTEHTPTPHHFLTWLQAEAVPRLEQLKVWPREANRFTYFYSEACWGMRILATAEVDVAEYARRHKAGDQKVIFDFAKANRHALLKKWVGRQLVDWRLTGEQRLFKKFMRAYWSQQGKRTARTLLRNIKRDQAVYNDLISMTSTSLIKEVANKHTWLINNVKDVRKHYSKACQWWIHSSLGRLYCSTHIPLNPSASHPE